MVFQCINIRQVPWEVLKTEAFGFQHLLRNLANVNVWKTMFDPYIVKWGYIRYTLLVNDSQLCLISICFVQGCGFFRYYYLPMGKQKGQNPF